MNLYLKFNDFGCDPLGEDLHTEAIRSASMSAVTPSNDTAGNLVPILSRRFDTISATRTRADWTETLEARLFGGEPFGITPQQYKALQAADGWRTVDQIVGDVADGADPAAVRQQVVRLIELGALDLEGVIGARANA